MILITDGFDLGGTFLRTQSEVYKSAELSTGSENPKAL